MNFTTKDGKTLDICVQIADNAVTFGITLLDDPTGNVTANLIANTMQQPSAQKLALLTYWLNHGKRTWEDLISVLRRRELNPLADDIEEGITAGMN